MTTIFIHGLESSRGSKAIWFGNNFPPILAPDFSGDLNKRSGRWARTRWFGEECMKIHGTYDEQIYKDEI